MLQSEYFSPTTPEEAVRALSRPGAAALSGGSDLLVQLRAGRNSPSVFVDLKRIPGATGIRKERAGFVIGGATCVAALGENAELSRTWPGVVEAANLIGSKQIQSRATLAGNLCNASPAADSVPALIAARAVCSVVGPSGHRTVPVESVPTGPGRNSLKPGEFILEIRLPARPTRAADAYLRLIPRTEMDIAIVGAGVSLEIDDTGSITQAHVALGAVAPTALLVADAGRCICGSRLDEQALLDLEAAVMAACQPISDKRGTADYRRKMAGVLARRAVLSAYGRAKECA